MVRLMSLAVPWRTSATRTTATGLSGSKGHVWEVAGVLASACARRASEGRSAVTRRGDALACPCVATMPVLALQGDLGTYWHGLCDALLGQWLVPTGSVERGESPGHAEVN
jgi:hypothetical protein